MIEKDAHTSNVVVSGTLSLYSTYTCALFDFGATHSFVSSAFIQKYALRISAIDNNIVLDKACVNCSILIAGHKLLARLHVMSMKDYDVILEWIF